MKGELSLITAVTENGVIGKDGGLPWRLRDELKLYKKTTMGSVLVMGRKTYESMMHPLPGRKSWVLSRSSRLRAEEFQKNHKDTLRFFEDKDELLAAASLSPKPIFINGGAQIYKLFLPKVARLYYTVVHTEIEGDAFFPPINWNEWRLLDQRHHPKDDRNNHSWTRKIYERI